MTTKTIYVPHECRLPSNFFEVLLDGQIEQCDCGQKWQLKVGRFFSKWSRV